MTTTTKPSVDAGRARLIKLIHVARRELERSGRLDEPGYREVLRAASRGKQDSTATMNYSELKAALERLKGMGFQVRRTKSGGTGDRALTVTPSASKVRALWLFLHVLGEVRDPSERALATYVKRIAHVDDLRWASADVDTLVETLKKWAMRRLPVAVAELKAKVSQASSAGALTPEQLALATDGYQALVRGQGFDCYLDAWTCLRGALNLPVATMEGGK